MQHDIPTNARAWWCHCPRAMIADSGRAISHDRKSSLKTPRHFQICLCLGGWGSGAALAARRSGQRSTQSGCTLHPDHTSASGTCITAAIMVLSATPFQPEQQAWLAALPYRVQPIFKDIVRQWASISQRAAADLQSQFCGQLPEDSESHSEGPADLHSLKQLTLLIRLHIVPTYLKT